MLKLDVCTVLGTLLGLMSANMKQPVLKEMVDLIGTAVLSRVESGLDKFDARSAAAAAENITGVWFSTKCPRTTVCYKRMCVHQNGIHIEHKKKL